MGGGLSRDPRSAVCRTAVEQECDWGKQAEGGWMVGVVVVVVRSVDLMMKLITFRFRLVALSPCSTSRASCTSILVESIYRPGESYQSRMTNALCPEL